MAIRVKSEERDSVSSSDGSDAEVFRYKIFVTTTNNQVADPRKRRDRSQKTYRKYDRDRAGLSKAYTLLRLEET
uniref:Uncharacterized protein n=1 Tax=Hyaloperonospora arabidopsidis (strain Emoy2) TaxID=559515 RepID=M4BLL2_HYAAE